MSELDVREPVVARKSTPFTERDLRDLELLRGESPYVGRSEASVLRDLLRRGMEAARQEVITQGYADLARERADSATVRRETARRRSPSWAGEA